MGKFSELGITCEPTNLVGDKINIKIILDEEITIEKVLIKASKFKGDCLYMQVLWKGKRYVVFTGAVVLIDFMKKIRVDQFPLEEITIILKNNCYIFT